MSARRPRGHRTSAATPSRRTSRKGRAKLSIQPRLPARVLALFAALLATAAFAAAATAATQVGYPAQSFAAWSPGSLGGAVTGQKPESKLWWADGKWWAAMVSVAQNGAHTIHRLDGTAWTDTGVLIDPRPTTKEDVLSLGTTLYVLSRFNGTGSSSQLRRYTYANGAYKLDSGFPVNVPGTGAETSTIARDSLGRLWLTYASSNTVYVAHSASGNDASWGAPFAVPGGTGLTSDDIASIVSFTDATGPAVGVMWSNQNTDRQHFAVHYDSNGDGTWRSEVALGGTDMADDHINLKTYEGRVFAVTKTSVGDTGTGALIKLLVRSLAGSWSAYTVATVAEGNTRPIAVLEIDPAVRKAFIFMTLGEGPSANGIAYKSTSLDTLGFSGSGTVFIQGSGGEAINDATSTKQNLTAASGVVVMASDGNRYWWNRLDFSSGQANTAPIASGGSATTTNGLKTTLTLRASDAETCELAFSIVSRPTHGTIGPISGAACQAGSPSSDSATVTYTPSVGYVGEDSFSFTASDGSAASGPAVQTITINDGSPPPAGGGIVFRAATSAGNATATTLTIDSPAGVGPGDVLLGSVAVRGNPIITAPAGWSLVRVDAVLNNVKQAVYQKVAGSAEPASHTWTFGTAQGAAGGIAAYAGVDVTNPVDVTAGSAGPTTGGRIVAPPVTTTGAYDLVVSLFSISALTTITPLDPLVGRYAASSTAGTYRVSAAAADSVAPSAGPTGSATATTSTDAAAVAQTVALRPSAVPPPTPANTAPAAADASATTAAGAQTTITLRGTDAETCELAFTILAPPAHGTLGPITAAPCSAGSPNADSATVAYTPAAGYAGSDSFTFRSSDGTADSPAATVIVTVSPAPAAIAFRSGSSAATQTDSKTLTIPTPADAVAGDVALASIDVRDVTGVTPPSGWTLVRSDDGEGSRLRQAIYLHVVSASEPAAFSWKFNKSVGAAGTILAYSGVDTANPIDTTSGTRGNATQITAPSVTTTVANAMIVGFFGIAAWAPIAPPAGATERFEVATTGGRKITTQSVDFLQAAAGPSGTRVATATVKAINVGQLVALRPAS
ncbi:MAG: Ig-like domain-containing protein [Gaiellaceae bacterium]